MRRIWLASSRGEGMAISANYPTPVTVNGFQCKNCTDVDYAKKHIDPAHPQSGPFNVNARTDPTRNHGLAVTYGGTLGSPSAASAAAASKAPGTQPGGVGGMLDLSL